MENMREIKKDQLDIYKCGHPMIKEGLDKLEVTQRALLVSLGLVYYMRLNSEYREKFVEVIDQLTPYYSVNFLKAYNDEVTIELLLMMLFSCVCHRWTFTSINSAYLLE